MISDTPQLIKTRYSKPQQIHITEYSEYSSHTRLEVMVTPLLIWANGVSSAPPPPPVWRTATSRSAKRSRSRECRDTPPGPRPHGQSPWSFTTTPRWIVWSRGVRWWTSPVRGIMGPCTMERRTRRRTGPSPLMGAMIPLDGFPTQQWVFLEIGYIRLVVGSSLIRSQPKIACTPSEV